ncbi:unnamed protein product [Parascedosporium putredinis]|uniref:Uncharacterized protein n=1 Tax=Parascedosporium putredinis TaxID=1442378 RepID=A0A9P1M8L8_9PEZI|nr:unnamed protein product [Parascedosporium putredinis]CAI7992963.1 unnamed protein product [Parascedosporium putredinis]
MDDPENAVALDHELHRLLTFLDSSERSYGSTRVLSEMFQGTWDHEESLFRSLFDRYGVEALKPFAHEACIFEIGAPMSLAKEEDCEYNTVSCLKFVLAEEAHKHVRTMYDVWDYELWRSALVDYLRTPMDKVQMSLFSTARDVLIFSVTNPFQSTKITVPEEFYPDRYIWERRREAVGLQYLRRRVRRKKEKYERREAPPGQPTLQEQLRRWEAAGKRAELLLDSLVLKAKFEAFQEARFSYKVYPRGVEDAPCVYSDELEDEAKARKKAGTRGAGGGAAQKAIQEIETLKQKCTEAEAFIGQLYTNPEQEGAAPMISPRYTLRGIGTASNIVYVCKRAEPTLIELGDSPVTQDQWWRLEYNASHSTPIKAEVVDFETVQSLIWDESNSLTMIYATDGAMDTPRIELPSGLQRFIKADNRSFQKELEQEEAAADANADIPMETLDSFDLQARSRSLSVDSMATNRASLGSMDSREDDFGLEDFLPPSSMDVEYQTGNVDHGHRRDVTPNQGLIHSSGMESPVLGHAGRDAAFSPGSGPEGSAVNVGDISLPRRPSRRATIATRTTMTTTSYRRFHRRRRSRK